MLRGLSARAGSSHGKLTEFANLYTLTSTELGAGSFAQVKLAVHKASGKYVAVKIIKKTAMKPKELKKLYEEVNILKKLKHPNIVKFYDSFEDQETMYVVMEYISGGQLLDRIVSDDNPFTESEIKRVIRSMALGLKHCKEKGVIHRDLKPENIMLTGADPAEGDLGGEIKIVDFNLSASVDAETVEFSILETMCGTPNYVAPEVLSRKPYDYKCDIWGIGVICYVLLSGGYLPFNPVGEGSEARNHLLSLVKVGKWDFTPENAWADVADDAKDFVSNLLRRDAEARFNYDQLLSHVWLNAERTALPERHINIDQLVQYNIKRKLLAASVITTAAAEFEKIMNDDKDVKQSVLGFKGESGTEAFINLLDEM